MANTRANDFTGVTAQVATPLRAEPHRWFRPKWVAGATGRDHRLVNHHLSILRRFGLVDRVVVNGRDRRWRWSPDADPDQVARLDLVAEAMAS